MFQWARARRYPVREFLEGFRDPDSAKCMREGSLDANGTGRMPHGPAIPKVMTRERTTEMIRPLTLLACLSVGTLAACVENTEPMPMPAMTGGNLSSVAADACRTAIAKQTGRPVSDVAVFDVAESEAGVGVMATVAGADAPWACQSSPDGRVAGVTYTGSEGSL